MSCNSCKHLVEQRSFSNQDEVRSFIDQLDSEVESDVISKPLHDDVLYGEDEITFDELKTKQELPETFHYSCRCEHCRQPFGLFVGEPEYVDFGFWRTLAPISAG